MGAEFNEGGEKGVEMGSFASGEKAGGQPAIREVVTTARTREGGWRDSLARIVPRRSQEVKEAVVTRVPDSDITVSARPPVSVLDITGGVLPERYSLTEKELYVEYAKAPLTVITASHDGEGADEYLLVGTPLSPKEVNAMMHFAAPDPAFGLGTTDIKTDWNLIYKKGNEELLAAHRRMPGWAQFEAVRKPILDIITNDYDVYNGFRQLSGETLTPVLGFTRTDTGIQINLDPPTPEMLQALNAALPKQIQDPERVSNGMGLMLLTAYSTEKDLWSTREGFGDLTPEEREKMTPEKIKKFLSKTNMMTSTQSLALAMRRVSEAQQDPDAVPEDNDLQKSTLLAALADYADTGKLTPITINGISERKLLRGDTYRAMRGRVAKRSGEIIMVAGATLFVVGVSSGISTADDKDGLDATYAALAPTDDEVAAAAAVSHVLVDLRYEHPNLAPILDPKIAKETAVLQANDAKLATKYKEKKALDETLATAGWVAAGGVLALGLGGGMRRRNSGW